MLTSNPMEEECTSCDSQWTGIHESPEIMNPSDLPDIPLIRHEGYRINSDCGTIWISGGFNVDTLQPSKAIFYLSEPNRTTWYNAPSSSEGRYFHASAVINNCLVIAGGYSFDKVLDSVEIFNLEKRMWKQGLEMPQGVGNAAFCDYNDELYISCGQYSEHGVYTSDKIQKYNIYTNQWNIITRYVSPGKIILYLSAYNGLRCFSILSIC